MTTRQDFWSRRKARVAAEDAAEIEARDAEVRAEARATLEEKSDAEVLEALGLPDPDTLGRGDDFSAFMAEAVPDRIRRWALRRLWGTNPTLANIDGLVDYGEDFTDSTRVIENMQTAYQVGKGMLAHVEELARQAEAAAEKAEAVLAQDDIPDEPKVEDETGEAEVAQTAEEESAYTYEVAAQETDEGWAPPPRRRMQFTFDDRSESAT